jgi:type I restriction enzyme, S subunit
MIEKVALGAYVDEERTRLGSAKKTIYSVTNHRGFIPALETFSKQVFSEDTSNYKVVRKGDLAFNPSRINVGSVALCPDEKGGAVSPMYTIVRCREGLLPEYLLYFLRSPVGLSEINHRTEGAVRFQLKFSDLQRIPIYLPSVSAQRRIIQILDEADELRRLRTRADRRTADLIPAIFDEMFGNPDHTNLSIKPLISLIRDDRPITYGILKPGDNIPDGVPYIRVLDIKNGRLNINELHKTSKEIAHQYRRSTLQPGDILITIRGTVGRTCIVPDNLQGANITQDTARLAPTNEVEVSYLNEFLNTPWAQGWMKHHMIGQAVKGINLGDVKKIPVPLPPLPLQRQFAARVSEVRALEEGQTASRKRLDDLFQSLLHHAFSGEL